MGGWLKCSRATLTPCNCITPSSAKGLLSYRLHSLKTVLGLTICAAITLRSSISPHEHLILAAPPMGAFARRVLPVAVNASLGQLASACPSDMKGGGGGSQ